MSSLVVHSNGDVPLCQNLDVTLGNIHSQTLDEIFNGITSCQTQCHYSKNCNGCPGLTSTANMTSFSCETWNAFCPSGLLKSSTVHISGRKTRTQPITNISRIYDTVIDRPLQTPPHRALPRPNVPIFLCLRRHGPTLAHQSLPCTSLSRHATEIYLRHVRTESQTDRTEVSLCEGHHLA